LRHTGTRLDAHLLFAALVTIHVFLIARRVLGDYLVHKRLVRSALTLSGLLILQLILGVGAFLSEFTLKETIPAVIQITISTTHVAVGALILISSVVLTLRIYRSTGGPESIGNHGFISKEVSA
jgi:heme A synthase